MVKNVALINVSFELYKGLIKYAIRIRKTHFTYQLRTRNINKGTTNRKKLLFIQIYIDITPLIGICIASVEYVLIVFYCKMNKYAKIVLITTKIKQNVCIEDIV